VCAIKGTDGSNVDHNAYPRTLAVDNRNILLDRYGRSVAPATIWSVVK
jgi:hypothetical protein